MGIAWVPWVFEVNSGSSVVRTHHTSRVTTLMSLQKNIQMESGQRLSTLFLFLLLFIPNKSGPCTNRAQILFA